MTDEQEPDDTPSEVTGIVAQLLEAEGWLVVRITYAEPQGEPLTLQQVLVLAEYRRSRATTWVPILPASEPTNTTGRSSIDPVDIYVSPGQPGVGQYRVTVVSTIGSGENLESERLIQVYEVGPDGAIRRTR